MYWPENIFGTWQQSPRDSTGEATAGGQFTDLNCVVYSYSAASLVFSLMTDFLEMET
jgi:hypothetical protein